MRKQSEIETLLKKVRACELCKQQLTPRPILQLHPKARILVAGQAPGRVTHEKGIPFDDASGNRLREWMGIDSEVFYDAEQIAILPMGFCFPGRGKQGDLPPPKLCADTWRESLLDCLPNLELTLVIGQYAIKWHLEGPLKTNANKGKNLTAIVRDWQFLGPNIVPLPHPSPRNNIWLKKNPWFGENLLPELKARIAALLRKP